MADMSVKLLLSVDAARAEAAMRGFQSRVSSSLGAVEARLGVARQRTDAFNAKWRETINLSRQVGRGMQVAGAGIMAAAAASLRAYSIQEEAENRLTKVIGGHSQALIANAAAIQKQTRYGDEAIISATAVGATYVGLRGDLEAAQHAAVNMAEAYGMDLTQAMHTLGKASTGQVGLLRRVGIMVDLNAFKAKGMKAVYEQIATETKNVAFTSDNFSKTLAQLKNRLGDIAEKAAPGVLKVVDRLTPTVERLVDRLERWVDSPVGKWAIEAATWMAPVLVAVGSMATVITPAVFAWNALTTAQLANATAANAAAAANVTAGAATGAGGLGSAGLGTLGSAGRIIGAVALPVAIVGISAAIASYLSGYGEASKQRTQSGLDLAQATLKTDATHFRTSTGAVHPLEQYPTDIKSWKKFQQENVFGGKDAPDMTWALGQDDFIKWQAGTTNIGGPGRQGQVDAALRTRNAYLQQQLAGQRDEEGRVRPSPMTRNITEEIARISRERESLRLQRQQSTSVGAAAERPTFGDSFTPALARARYEADLEKRLSEGGSRNGVSAGQEYMGYVKQQQSGAVQAAIAEAQRLITDAAGQADYAKEREKAEKIVADAQTQAAQQIVSAEQRVMSAQEAAQEKWKADQKRIADERMKRLKYGYDVLQREAGQWSGAWGGENTNMGRWLQGVSERAGGIAEGLQDGGRAGGYQQPSAPVTQRTETVTRHVLEIGSDANTARALLSNRDFRDQLIRLVREQMALERGQVRAQ